MKSWKKPTNETVERSLSLIEKETDRQFFFSRLENPRWIQPLAERGCFKSPPAIRYLPDGQVQYPFWPELHYLKNVCKDAPEEVIKIVLRLPAVDNPRVYDSILEIARELAGEQSAQLKPKMLEYAKLETPDPSSRVPQTFGSLDYGGPNGSRVGTRGNSRSILPRRKL